MTDGTVLLGLGAVLALVLALPFFVRWVEEELEAFLLAMGAMAVTVSGLWTKPLVVEALEEPLKITAAVLLFGFAFRRWRGLVAGGVARLTSALGLPAFLFVLVVGLGLASSVLTAIVASLVLVEAVSALRLPRETEVSVVVFACYAIGLGAVLTPVGEPLSTIAVARLAGEPHHAGFFFLADLLWAWLAPGLVLLGAFAARHGQGAESDAHQGLTQDAPEDVRSVLLRAVKVYVFVAALVLLGHGLTPLVDRYIVGMRSDVLFWANISSAALDNATLAAAELSPRMDLERIRAVLLGLLVAGGMLIPGNIPNIISAGKLGIKSREWAAAAVPLGLALMAAYFAALKLVGG